MFKLQRLEITGFKSFADYTEVVFTGNGITAVVGPNGCGKSNVSDAISWVLGEQRAKSLRGGEMKDVVFAGTKNRKPSGMAEVVLHLVRDESAFDIDEDELEDIDQTLSGIDDHAVDMDAVEGSAEIEIETPAVSAEANGMSSHEVEVDGEVETVMAAQVGSIHTIETRIKTKRHWRPRSFALDFAPGEAVSVTRRLYLSGESEYQLNGKTCRLRDITDLFAGTGLSGAHYAIIEQGRIGQILSAKPADRRSLIEEAAGISKFRARQRAAELRLDSAKTNLGRISDIVSEVDKQVNSLRRQAAKTRRFKILQEDFRSMLRQLYAAEGRHLSALADAFRVQLAGAVTLESNLLEQVKSKEDEARNATQQARDAEESLSEIRKIHAGNVLERDRAEREHLYKSDQIVTLNNRCEALRGEISLSEQRVAMLAGEIERLRLDEKDHSEHLSKAESELRAAEDDYRKEAQALAAIESSLETLRASLMQHTGAAERFDEIARQLDNSVQRLELRVEGLQKEGVRADETLEANRNHAAVLATNLAAEESKLAELNKEKEQLVAAAAGARSELHAADETLRTLQEDYSAKRHRLTTLLELEEKRAVYAPSVQRLFAEQETVGVRLSGVLADLLDVDPGTENAIESIFGIYLQAVVARSAADADRITAWLGTANAGRTALIVIPDDDTAAAGRAPTGDGTVAAALGAPEYLETFLRLMFPREMAARLVENLDDVELDSEEMAVSLSGEVRIGKNLRIAGSGAQSLKNESLLGFKRELKTLEKVCSRLTREIERSASAVEKARARLVELESRTVDLQSLIIKVDRGIHVLQIQVHNAREEISRAERHRKLISDETSETHREIHELKQKRAESLLNKEAADAACLAENDSLDAVTARLVAAKAVAESSNAVLSEKRMVAATSGERSRSVLTALRRVENEYKETDARLSALRLELAEGEAKIGDLHAAITDITDRIATAGDDIVNEERQLAEAVSALTAAREAADETSAALADLNRRSAEARNSRAAIEVRQAEAVTELKNIAENCQHELNVPLDDLVGSVAIDEDFVLEDSRGEAGRMRERLENFGAINMLALEELADAEERMLFLTTQRQDIVESIAATEEALREIKERSREKFKSAFEAINENFTVFFQELFGGGRGEMTLLESDDILEAGIEVVAQPPGKRLQNILLLSGGEKAMTAIALVLAIFKYRPSPFCLLDEVDAPLDDANVGRFAGKIAEMSEKTQFIVITHNKRTMEAAKALYGVTMQEPGVSKVVSVKFD